MEDFMWRRFLLASCLAMSIGLAHAQGNLSATYGTAVELTIQNDLPQLITFEGKTGETVYVSQFSETTDIPLFLYGPDGAQLSESFDFQQYVIPPVQLPTDGTYTVSVQRPDYDDTTGTTQIIIDTITVTELSETPTTGSFSQPGEMRWFNAQATAGGLYRMTALCENCSFFEILPNQDVVGATYTQQNPLLILSQWQADGTVLFGSYTTTASDYSFALIPVTPIPLTQGTPTEGVITSSAFETFSFTSAEAKAWRLDAAMSNQGDRLMGLFQFEGRPSWDALLLTDTGSGPEGNPQITPFIAPMSTTYYVVIQWQSYREEVNESPYSVTLRPESLRQLTPDGVAFDGEVAGTEGTQRYLYRGTAGELLTLTLTKTGGEGQPSIRIVGPEDEAVVFFGRAATRLEVDLQLPSDGLYQIAISNIGYDPVSILNYTIALQTRPTP
jgi:hypothetical protein